MYATKKSVLKCLNRNKDPERVCPEIFSFHLKFSQRKIKLEWNQNKKANRKFRKYETTKRRGWHEDEFKESTAILNYYNLYELLIVK